MTSDTDPACLLYLIVETSKDPSVAHAMLSAALAAGPVASVLITPPANGKLTESDVNPLVTACQDNDVVVLIADSADLVEKVGADGLHISWREDVVAAYQTARVTLGNDAVIGGDAGRSRHVAMELGEAGADYVAFGIPGHVKDRDTAEARQQELIAWWAEIFEPACVAFDIAEKETVGQLVEAGADFVAVKIKSGQTTDEVRAYVADLIAVLDHHSEIRNQQLAAQSQTAGASS